jgi:hypothetical protein
MEKALFKPQSNFFTLIIFLDEIRSDVCFAQQSGWRRRK